MGRHRTLTTLASQPCALAAAILALCVAYGRAAPPDDPGLGPDDRKTLSRYARDTWRSFEAMALPSGLPADALCRDEDGVWRPTEKTMPTDIAAYLWSTLAAEALQIIEPAEAYRRLDRTLATLAGMERTHGFFFDNLDPRTGATLRTAPESGRPIHPLLSAVDNGWLATALIMIRNTRPALRERAEALLKPMDFGFFYAPYDPAAPGAHPGLLHGSYQVEDQTFGPLHQVVNIEPRIVSYIGIARGQLPPEHYYRVFRTLPPDRPQQQQIPEGEWRTYRGVSVFEGHYTYRGMRIVPSWGGSMFEALMVPLFVPEARWAPRSWGINHPLYVRAQIEHGLDVRLYGFWGFSPASKPEGGYRPYGVDALGTDPEGYHSHNPGPKDGAEPPTGPLPNGVVTPHASFLALPFAPREAMANLRALEGRFPTLYTRYGFRDSVNLSTGRVSDCVLALDQGMIMAAIANALADNVMQHAFSDGLIEEAIRPLIAPEEFTAGPPDNAVSDIHPLESHIGKEKRR
ncbi:MAG: DUF3131 domain-containing protein [Isosphaeraceae bacterium]|nr:DUF3131 domain-containing protein [Isosphaeraceae bacterium]